MPASAFIISYLDKKRIVRRGPGIDEKILGDPRQDDNVEAHRLYLPAAVSPPGSRVPASAFIISYLDKKILS